MTAKKTGNDEVTFTFDPSEDQMNRMKKYGMTEGDISRCLEQFLTFIYGYKPSLMAKLQEKRGIPDKKIDKELLRIAGMYSRNPDETHELAALLLNVFGSLMEEIHAYKGK